MNWTNELKEKSKWLFIYYGFYAFLIIQLWQKIQTDVTLWFATIPFLFFGILALDSLLQPPIKQVIINQTILRPEPKPNRFTPLLLILTIFLLLGFMLMFFYNGYIVSINQELKSSWIDRESYLISICQIDYNQYILEQQNKMFSDLNGDTNKLINIRNT